MEITVVELLVPTAPSTLAQSMLLILRLFMGLCFIRHGWPKLRNLNTWAQGLNTPAWLCFLSAGSMWAGGIALLVGLFTPLAAFGILVSMAYAMVLELRSGFPFISMYWMRAWVLSSPQSDRNASRSRSSRSCSESLVPRGTSPPVMTNAIFFPRSSSYSLICPATRIA